MCREIIIWVFYMVDVEHDETRRDGIGGLACAIAIKAACMRRDDRQLLLETSKFVVAFAIEELDLVADVLYLRLLHSKLDIRPEDWCRFASGNGLLEANSWI